MSGGKGSLWERSVCHFLDGGVESLMAAVTRKVKERRRQVTCELRVDGSERVNQAGRKAESKGPARKPFSGGGLRASRMRRVIHGLFCIFPAERRLVHGDHCPDPMHLGE